MRALARRIGRTTSLFDELGPAGAFVLLGVLIALLLIVLVDWGFHRGDPHPDAPGSRLPRAAWAEGNPDPGALDPMGRVTRVTIHHSAVLFRTVERNATARRIENIRRYHRNDKGWADIAYHFVVDRAGRQWEARDLDHQGAHAGDFELNRGNVGIMLLGNFESQDPSAEQLVALESLLSELLRTYRVDRSHVFWHRELKATACPGEKLVAWLERWRNRS